MRSNPGDQVIDFVMLHLGAHQRPDDEHIAETYHDALEQVTALAANDQRLCLTLLADLAGHFATTLGQQGDAGAIQQVIDDWAGRGWTLGVERARSIPPPRSPSHPRSPRPDPNNRDSRPAMPLPSDLTSPMSRIAGVPQSTVSALGC